MENYFKWELIKRVMDFIQFVVVIVGVIFTAYQVNDMTKQQLGRENELSSSYYDRLTTGTNGKITIAVAHNSSIFNDFNSDDMDNYLNTFNDIGDRLNRNLLDSSIVCNDFYDVTESAYKNKEIKNYIVKSRKSDPTYFVGFDDLHGFLIESCKN